MPGFHESYQPGEHRGLDCEASPLRIRLDRRVRWLRPQPASTGSQPWGVGSIGIETGASQFVPPGGPPAVVASGRRQFGRLIVTNDAVLVKTRRTSVITTTAGPPITRGSYRASSPTPTLTVSWLRPELECWWSTRAQTRWTVDLAGRVVKVVAILPQPCRHPTRYPPAWTRGPDRALYIGELTGGGNAAGASVVWRYDPATGLAHEVGDRD